MLGCVELVTAAFAEAADVMTRLASKQKRWKSGKELHEALLLQLLEQGAKSVQKAYDEGESQLGSVFRVGDDETREQLLCIAIELNAGVVQPLHIACNADKSTPDLIKIHEAAITARHDAVRSLGALRRSLDHLRPPLMSRFSPDSSVCGDDFAGDAAPPPPPQKSGLRRMMTAGSSSSHRRTYSEGPIYQAPSSPQPSIIVPAPLSIATTVLPVSGPISPITSLASTRQRASSDVSGKRSARQRVELAQHPDLPNMAYYAKFKDSTKTKSKHNRRDSSGSVRSVTTVDSTIICPAPRPVRSHTISTLPYHAVVPEEPVAPVAPTLLTTSLHAGRAPIHSPIPEVDDSASVDLNDYDAESIYSQPEQDTYDDDDDPGTPISDTGSTISTARNSSSSEAQTPTTAETPPPQDEADNWPLPGPLAKTDLPITPVRIRANTIDSSRSSRSGGESVMTSTSTSIGKGRKWGFHRYSRSLTDSVVSFKTVAVAAARKEPTGPVMKPMSMGNMLNKYLVF